MISENVFPFENAMFRLKMMLVELQIFFQFNKTEKNIFFVL